MNLSPNLSQKTWRNPVTRALGHYGAGSALQEPHTARPNQSSVGMASTNPRGGSMGLQGPPYAVLSPLVTDPLAPPGDPESSLFLTCHFVRKGSTSTKSPKWAKLERLMHQERDGSKKGSKKHPKPGLNLLDPTVRLAGGLKKHMDSRHTKVQLLRPDLGSNHAGLKPRPV